jgi:CBS domain-containing protein
MANEGEKKIFVYPLVITVADIMNTEVVSVGPNTSIDKIVEIFKEKNFSGIPVVSERNTLLGVITQNELMTKENGLHIPTLIKILQEVKAPILTQERLLVRDILKPLNKLVAKDVMNDNPLFLNADAPFIDALNMFSSYPHANPIIIVNNAKQVVGILSRRDIIKIFALKELGEKSLNKVDDRKSQEIKGSETSKAVAGVVEQIKKEFFFLPKHKAAKWIFLGIVLFVIGFASSVFFVVKLPDFSQKSVKTVSQIPIGEGAVLSLSADSDKFSLGSDVFLKVILKTKGAIVVNGASVSIKLDPQMLSLVDEPLDLNPLWPSLFKIIDLKSNTLVINWKPNSPQILTGGSIDLGLIKFKAIKKGSVSLDLDFSQPREDAGSVVVDNNNQNILDSVSGVSFEIF